MSEQLKKGNQPESFKVVDESFKREILIGIIILLVTLFTQIGGWIISRNVSKADAITNKKIELADRFNRNIQDYYYLSQFSLNQTILKFNYTSKIDAEADAPHIVYLTQKSRLGIDDSLRINYPTIYAKSLEADLKGAELYATLDQIDLNYDNPNIKAYTDYLRKVIPPNKEFLRFMDKRISKSNTRISDEELENFMNKYLDELLSKMYMTLELMVDDYSK